MAQRMEDRWSLAMALTIVLTFPAISTRAQVNVNVTTWHNDDWRTGQNTNQPYLTTGINKNNFGLLCKDILTLQSTGKRVPADRVPRIRFEVTV